MSANQYLYHSKLNNRPQLSLGKFRRKPATRRFDWYFAPILNSEEWICTSQPLIASIRVSPDFTTVKNSSTSFGSGEYCSGSPSRTCEAAGVAAIKLSSCCVHCAKRFSTLRLAIVFDSLIRVTRRVISARLTRSQTRAKNAKPLCVSTPCQSTRQ